MNQRGVGLPGPLVKHVMNQELVSERHKKLSHLSDAFPFMCLLGVLTSKFQNLIHKEHEPDVEMFPNENMSSQNLSHVCLFRNMSESDSCSLVETFQRP